MPEIPHFQWILLWSDKYLGDTNKFPGKILLEGLFRQIKHNPKMAEYTVITDGKKKGKLDRYFTRSGLFFRHKRLGAKELLHGFIQVS